MAQPPKRARREGAGEFSGGTRRQSFARAIQGPLLGFPYFDTNHVDGFANFASLAPPNSETQPNDTIPAGNTKKRHGFNHVSVARVVDFRHLPQALQPKTVRRFVTNLSLDANGL